MNAEKQRVAIAEACGWKQDSRPPYQGYWVPPGERQLSGHGAGYYAAKPPNYLNSLDAMHEAEKVLTGDQLLAYRDFLVQDAFFNGEHRKDVCLILLTAAKKAECFLRCLNLWEPAPHD